MKRYFILIVLFLFACGPSKEELIEQTKKQTEIEVRNKINQEQLQKQKVEMIEQTKKQTEIEVRNKINQEQLQKQNDPKNFLKSGIALDKGDIFNEDRLKIMITNIDPKRKIANVYLKIKSFTKTDAYLGFHNEIIYDWIKPLETYNRMVGFKKFHPQSAKYEVIIEKAEFSDK